MLQPEFLGGVVEGFYGQAWSHCERLHLFQRMATLGLNTYLYAPKDDLKHRVIWREPYHDSELSGFRELVQAGEQHGVNFIYGFSPGLDIRFSDEVERTRIKSRFDQLRKVGVRHYALLFDDLPGKMDEVDCRAFDSLARAQCDVTNAVFGWIRDENPEARFLFCPTPYCDRMDRNGLGGAGYLDQVGQRLSPEIDVLWTGPEVVSAEISVESVEWLSCRLRRPPVIWDNLFANDYDFRRVYCGPYSGRPVELRSATRGILINPNNEYPLNFIPLRTLAAFLQSEDKWEPRQAFLDAVREWLPYFETVTQPLSLADLILLADCFYLPHSEGPEAERRLTLVDRLLAGPPESWGDAYSQFLETSARIRALFDRLSELHDRKLFGAWSRYAWALKEEFHVIGAVLAQKKAGRDIVGRAGSEEGLPGTFRGGVLAKFERLVTIDDQGNVRVRTPA
jgi:protein O-GlcNAcase/histone acetyltransferase